MKILLLQPNYAAHIVHPPLGLGYLASFLRKNGYKVSIFDGSLKNALIKDFSQAVSEYEPDLIGISVLTRGHNQIKCIIKALKQEFKKIPIVIGGCQVSADPRAVLKDLKADFAVIGEGEITFLELIKAIEINNKNFKEINGIAFKNPAGKIIITKSRELINDLDSIPFLAWDLMPPKQYRIVPILVPARGLPIAPIFTSRGCPYNCSFCASQVTWTRRIRFRSPENVVAEIKMLKNKFGVREIHFSDDNFTIDIKRAEKICDIMIDEKINLPWQCPNGVRIDRLTLPLLEKMKQAGCYALGLGIESGNQTVLNKNNKNLNLKVVPQVLENLKKVGIQSYGFFILGLPGDSKESMEQTINFALKNSFDRAWFNIFTPYPGSPAFTQWLGNGRFDQIDWDKHDCSTAVKSIPGVSNKEIENLQKKALMKFYLRPKVFFKVISSLGPKEIITFLMSTFFAKFAQPIFLFTHQLIRKRK